ncbi:peptidoglycan DD-metalloendopeptidase family protein [Methylophilus sp. 5]|uniref:peptidoglycan DD-metalloendopeptidase family protein n=1 Tax=Methylophilus sp. 5 TaxID=1112274 RepID=UPI00049086C4|nr:peptidoglycan DD-metalloendopeptidase family protein [Methylophilus sp. 5]
MTLRTLLTAWGAACTLAACALNSPMPRAPVSSSPVTNDTKPATLGANQYLVQKGDTLYSIGRKFGIPFMKLANINQLQTPYEIHVGQVLNLNAKTSNTGMANNKINEAASTPDDAEVVTSAISRPDTNGAGDAAQATTAPSNTAPTPAEADKSTTATDLEAIADSDIQWQWPLAGKVSTGFDAQTNKGFNITGNPGQVINAAGAGKVIYSGMDVRGYGKLIIIKHNSNLLSVYAHQGNSLVKEGAFVTSGEKLANLPLAANSKSPVLHFEIRQKGKPVDPASYLPNNPATIGNNS